MKGIERRHFERRHFERRNNERRNNGGAGYRSFCVTRRCLTASMLVGLLLPSLALAEPDGPRTELITVDLPEKPEKPSGSQRGAQAQLPGWGP